MRKQYEFQGQVAFKIKNFKNVDPFDETLYVEKINIEKR